VKQFHLGETLLQAGDLEKAKAHLLNVYESSLPIHKQSRGMWSAVESLCGLYDLSGRPEDSEEWLRRNLELKQASPENGVTAQAYVRLATHLLKHERWQEAESLLRDALRIRQQHEPDAWTTFNTMSQLGGANLGQARFEEAEPLLIAGFEGMRKRLKDIPPYRRFCVDEALDRLVKLYVGWNKPESADTWRKALEVYRQQTKVDADAHEQQALALQKDGKLDEAIEWFRKVKWLREGDGSSKAGEPSVTSAVWNLAAAYRQAKEFDRAATLWRWTYHSRLKALGRESRHTIDAQNWTGVMLAEAGLFVEAAPLLLSSYRDAQTSPDVPPEWPATYRQRLADLLAKWPKSADVAETRLQLEVARAAHGYESKETFQAHIVLGNCLFTAEKYADAETVFHEAAALSQKRAAGSWYTPACRSSQGAAILKQGRFADAELLLVAAYEDLKRAAVPNDQEYFVKLALERVIQLYDAWDKPAEAARWRQELALLQQSPSRAAALDKALALYREGGKLQKAGKLVEAEAALRECLSIRERLAPAEWYTFNAKSYLGSILSDQRKFSEAEPLLLAGYEGLKERQASIPTNFPYLQWAAERLVMLYKSWDQPDKAAKWEKEMDALKRAGAKSEQPAMMP
jgi:tetratricopeptide (TPR) repeat protein